MLDGDESEPEKPTTTIMRSKSYERFRRIGRALSARQRKFKDLVKIKLYIYMYLYQAVVVNILNVFICLYEILFFFHHLMKLRRDLMASFIYKEQIYLY